MPSRDLSTLHSNRRAAQEALREEIERHQRWKELVKRLLKQNTLPGSRGQ